MAEGGEEDFFKDYPDPAKGNDAAAAGTGGDFFSSAPAEGGEEPAPQAAQGGDYGFVMPESTSKPEQIEVEDADDDVDDEDAIPSTPPAIKQWRIDYAERLEKKQAYEKKVRAETQAEAKDTLAKMHKRWEERVASNKKVNQDFEKKFISDRDAVLKQFSKPGQKPNWNVIPHLANLTGSYAEGQRDTSRMRSVILKLKN
uniref:Clathrin light chain n=3 Tax=Rhodosorus marinus TaxID=101924 RepID=A0A7S3EEK3_9RHOD|mmetsp:Transcript_30282/g.116154  ORF Transcript_30282/g.116154 Transcript_30282/m.116154 type:complete len:200 (+) Transcript_30282:182-781(+)|eukprot:CAMPEP_0113960086 /NCGR_PEP_ID=MMETSP0011_2-20120614/4513_1 /TAXON_ID=101924 /ORGANISM="Rhodosorus marinus" /LENGTH=199 /DNA_ID=CAMNT_0000971487 /DNA_START=114 /DNA_END=716 /DNA_ORIENTATION=+ /assembly_acc=CAM_ASM_000156